MASRAAAYAGPHENPVVGINDLSKADLADLRIVVDALPYDDREQLTALIDAYEDHVATHEELDEVLNEKEELGEEAEARLIDAAERFELEDEQLDELMKGGNYSDADLCRLQERLREAAKTARAEAAKLKAKGTSRTNASGSTSSDAG